MKYGKKYFNLETDAKNGIDYFEKICKNFLNDKYKKMDDIQSDYEKNSIFLKKGSKNQSHIRITMIDNDNIEKYFKDAEKKEIELLSSSDYNTIAKNNTINMITVAIVEDFVYSEKNIALIEDSIMIYSNACSQVIIDYKNKRLYSEPAVHLSKASKKIFAKYLIGSDKKLEYCGGEPIEDNEQNRKEIAGFEKYLDDVKLSDFKINYSLDAEENEIFKKIPENELVFIKDENFQDSENVYFKKDGIGTYLTVEYDKARENYSILGQDLRWYYPKSKKMSDEDYIGIIKKVAEALIQQGKKIELAVFRYYTKQDKLYLDLKDHYYEIFNNSKE